MFPNTGILAIFMKLNSDFKKIRLSDGAKKWVRLYRLCNIVKKSLPDCLFCVEICFEDGIVITNVAKDN